MGSSLPSPSSHEQAHRRARALMQHQRVMDEAAQVFATAERSRRLASATPIFANATGDVHGVRNRVEWVQAS